MRMMRIPTVWTVNLVVAAVRRGDVLDVRLPPAVPADPGGHRLRLRRLGHRLGLLLLPQTAATFLAGLASGRLAARFGSKALLVVGATLTSLGTLGLVLLHDQVWQVVAETTLLGLAFGLAFAAMSNLVVDAVPQSQTGVASGMNANIRTVGGALGGAVLASVVTAGARPDGLPGRGGLRARLRRARGHLGAGRARGAVRPGRPGPHPRGPRPAGRGRGRAGRPARAPARGPARARVRAVSEPVRG